MNQQAPIAQGPLEASVRAQPENESGCWHCNKWYPITKAQCPNCCATNPNVDLESATMESDDNSHIDHDWKFQDDSFDHEFGTERVHYWQCERCGATREMEAADYHDDGL